MKKTLLTLLALSFPSVDYAHVTKDSHVHGANIERFAPYRHSEAKKEGNLMPRPIGKFITVTDLYIKNSKGVEGVLEDFGKVYGFDRNPEDEKNKAEYEYIVRACDKYKNVKIYAVYDVPNKLLYVDSTRDGWINSITKLDMILGVELPMIPIKCGISKIEKERRKKSI